MTVDPTAAGERDEMTAALKAAKHGAIVHCVVDVAAPSQAPARSGTVAVQCSHLSVVHRSSRNAESAGPRPHAILAGESYQ